MAYCDDPKCWNKDHVPGGAVQPSISSSLTAKINAKFGEYEAEIQRLNLQSDRMQNALEECEVRLRTAHDGGCVLPLRRIVKRGLGRGESSDDPAEYRCSTSGCDVQAVCKFCFGCSTHCVDKRNDEARWQAENPDANGCVKCCHRGVGDQCDSSNRCR